MKQARHKTTYISLNKTRTAGLILIILLEENNKELPTAKVKTQV